MILCLDQPRSKQDLGTGRSATGGTRARRKRGKERGQERDKERGMERDKGG